MDEPDFLKLDRRAVEETVRVVSHATSDSLARPTPCTEWNLSDLLAHMTAQHRGFAAAARGHGADLGVWQARPLGADPVATYREAADEVVAAFASDGVLDREFALPEITRAMAFPARQAISFHFIDYVAHGWDVARSLDVELELDAEVLAAALVVAQRVPDGDERLLAGAAFRPGMSPPAGSSTFDQILFSLGRSPSWPG
jgi:uncharacterized protein (TIGR03086 family)